MAKDWNGNAGSIFKTLGASNHTENERQADDFYATDPVAIDLPLGLRRFPDGRGRSNVDRGYGVWGANTDCTDETDLFTNTNYTN
jgi:hypothetical protein